MTPEDKKRVQDAVGAELAKNPQAANALVDQKMDQGVFLKAGETLTGREYFERVLASEMYYGSIDRKIEFNLTTLDAYIGELGAKIAADFGGSVPKRPAGKLRQMISRRFS